MSERLRNIAMVGVGAALAFWFSYFVWEIEKAENAATAMTVIWVSAIFAKMWIDKKAENG